jgi:hypothetical protein
VWEWYRIGLCAGIGVGLGVLASALFAQVRAAWTVAVLAALGVGIAVGFVVEDWNDAVAGALGAVVGGFGTMELVRGALRRGGTRGGTATLVGGAAVALAALAFVPFVGFVEAVVVPALALRARKAGGDRYAGLRILARD